MTYRVSLTVVRCCTMFYVVLPAILEVFKQQSHFKGFVRGVPGSNSQIINTRYTLRQHAGDQVIRS